MVAKKRIKNPFYPVLVLIGVAFAITACGFAVMMVRDINATGQLEAESGGGLIRFFQEHGFTMLMIELGVLALATFGAIATDEMWADRVTPQARAGPEAKAPLPADDAARPDE